MLPCCKKMRLKAANTVKAFILCIPFRFAEKHMGYLDTYYYLSFGGGPRTCIGIRLALIEMKLATVHLMQKFKFKTSSKTLVKTILIFLKKGLFLQN